MCHVTKWSHCVQCAYVYAVCTVCSVPDKVFKTDEIKCEIECQIDFESEHNK